MPITSTNEIVRSAPAHRVYIKSSWAGEWALVDYLYCLVATKCLNPELPQAVLDWRYGLGYQAGSLTRETFSPQSLLDYYVKIEIDQDPGESALEWIGVIQEVHDARQGALIVGGARVITGQQSLIAFGLESLLDRVQYRSSYIWNVSADWKVKRGLPFNEPNPRHRPAEATPKVNSNRSASVGDRGVYVFSDDLTTAAPWSTRDIVSYLLTHHAPVDENGFAMIQWALVGVNSLPDWDVPVKDFHGRTTKSILDELLDRRRALGWYTTLSDETPPRVIVNVVSFTDVPLVMPGGGIQQANPNVIQLDFDTAIDVTESPIKESSTHEVEQVLVVGARIRSCFSISKLDDTLEADWTAANQTSYDAGSGITTGDIDEQAASNAQTRQQKSLARVYSWFRLAAAWDGQVGDGIGGAKTPFLPDVIETGEADGPERFYWAGLRFLDELPIRDVDSQLVVGAFQRPLVVISGSPGVYRFIDRLADDPSIEGEGDGNGIQWTASIRMQDHAPGVIVEVHGAPQHIFAYSDFTPLDIDRPAELDWQDNMICTVCIEADRHVQAAHPNVPPARDAVRTVTIDVGDKFRLDYIAAGTVIRLDATGALVHQASAEYVRDDREKLEALAVLAYEWYSKPRRAFRFEVRQLYGVIGVGDFVTTLGADATLRTINAVVTSVTWNMADGRTQIATDFADLDFAQMV